MKRLLSVGTLHGASNMKNYRRSQFFITLLAFSILTLAPLYIYSGDIRISTVSAQSVPAGLTSACAAAYFDSAARQSACNNTSDLNIIAAYETGATSGSLDIPIANIVGNNSALKAAAQNSCSALNPGSWFAECVWKPLLSWTASWLLTLGAFFLKFGGMVFDFFIKALVVDLTGTLKTSNFEAGIREAWRLFRDFGNLLIIGVFVYIAIMTILNSTTYGAKRLLANALIVAVLINFSFLFTIFVVEMTNQISSQFYKALNIQTGTSSGIAEVFLQQFGITNVWDTRVLTDPVAAANGGAAALLYGFVSLAFLGFLSYVLLYGAFMILVRAILLIFSLITSSLAFATLLLPSTRNHPIIGWDAWLSNFLKAAFFGPLLMIFLSITLVILQRAASTASGAGDAIKQLGAGATTMSERAWSSIIILLIGTAFLYLSIRAASSFSASIGGFKFGSAIAALPLFGGARLLSAASTSRFGAGRLADLARTNLERRAAEAVITGNPKRGARLQLMADKFSGIARKDMNVLGGQLGSSLAKMSGLPHKAMVGTAGGYRDRVEAKAQRTLKVGEKIAQTIQQDPQLAAAAKEKKIATVVSDTDKQDIRKVRDEYARDENDAFKSKRESEVKMTEAVGALTKQIDKLKSESGGAPDKAKQQQIKELEVSIEREKSMHKSVLEEQANRIAGAKKSTMEKEQQILQKIAKRVDPSNTSELAGEIAVQIADKGRSGGLFMTPERDTALTKEIRSRTESGLKTRRIRDFLGAIEPETLQVKTPPAASIPLQTKLPQPPSSNGPSHPPTP